jgi:hypothetical protein
LFVKCIKMSYTFDNMSRIGGDQSYLAQSDVQNVEHANYMLQNFFGADCSMKPTTDLATSQPGIMFNGGHTISACGTNIDDNSKLQIGVLQTKHIGKLDLFHRPFLTVPYLGRGSVDPVMEAQLKQGESFSSKQTVNNLSEKSYAKYHNTPMLDVVQQQVREKSQGNDFGRVGLSSRDVNNDRIK